MRKREIKISELQRLIDCTLRLGGVLENASNEESKLRKGIDKLTADKHPDTAVEIYKLKQSVQWLEILIGGSLEDVKYIKSHLKAIIAIIQLEAAKKLDKEEKQIEETF